MTIDASPPQESERLYVWDKIIDLFRTSAVTQGVITGICLLGTFWLLLIGREVPTYIQVLDGIIVGFFFGGKLGVMQGMSVRAAEIIKRIDSHAVTP